MNPRAPETITMRPAILIHSLAALCLAAGSSSLALKQNGLVPLTVFSNGTGGAGGEAGSFTSGQTLVIDGGRMAGAPVHKDD